METSIHREFTLSTDVRNLAILWIVFFGMLLAFTQLAIPPESRLSARIALAAFWGCWMLAAIYELLYIKRFRMIVDGSRLAIAKPFRSYEIDLSQVNRARWHHLPTLLKLKEGRHVLRLDFRQFRPEDRLPLIRLLRDAIPHTAQQHWDVFCHRIALPWQRSAAGIDTPRPLREDEILLTRRSWDRLLGVCLGVVAVAAAATSWLARSGRPLISLIPIVAIWLTIRATCPERGQRYDRITQSRDVPFLASLLVWALVGGVAVSAVHHYWASDFVAWIGMPLVMLGFLIVGSRFEKRRAAERQEAAQGADAEWNRLLDVGAAERAE